MSRKKILVVNPNGTNIYDQVTIDVAETAVSSDTTVIVRNLSGSVPKTAFLPATPVLMNQLLTAVVDAEKEGFLACLEKAFRRLGVAG